jgi:Ran GTPase-activating protein (RanGAP) involved in mRNA processing and transport
MMMKNNVGPPIEELHLSDLPTEEQQIEAELKRKISSMIISSLKQNKKIKKLLIAPQAVLHQSIPSSIATILYDNTVLKSLILRGCGISHVGATKISCALASNTSITVIDLSNNSLGKGICSVALALELNNTIQKLKLSGTGTGREGGEAIVEALTVNKSLAVLDMGRNSLVGRNQARKITQAKHDFTPVEPEIKLILNHRSTLPLFCIV